MGLVIGMDEAGYGPNLGPLVVTVTAWEVPGHPRDTDFWTAFADIVSQKARTGHSRLHVADSKRVYTPSRGIKNLETAVLCALRLLGKSPESFQGLWRMLAEETFAQRDAEPWFADNDLQLPDVADERFVDEMAQCWQHCCSRCGIQLKALRSDIVLTQRFNRMTQEANSKGVALSRISLGLLRQVWDPDSEQRTLIIADKHGGRNRYTDLLAETLDGHMVFELQQAKQCSIYRIGKSDVHFQMKAESHFPVAMASMVSKYVRELAMKLFNRFWQERVSGLKATAGYPVDARRFKQEIAEVQEGLEIADDVLWRER